MAVTRRNEMKPTELNRQIDKKYYRVKNQKSEISNQESRVDREQSHIIPELNDETQLILITLS